MVTKEKEKKEKASPEEIFDALMRKWSLLVLKDMFMGAKHFKDFLEMNPRISGKVLCDQLKNLEKYGFIEKVVVSTTPLKAEYRLTEQGRGLNRVLYELMVFARDYIAPGIEHEFFKEENLKKYFGV